MRKSVVGVDASRMIGFDRTGTETYTFQIVQALLSEAPELTFRLYFNAESPPAALPETAQLRPIPFPRLWTHLRLSAEMLARTPDLLFVPAHVVPLLHPKSIVTIHDLGYLAHPESHPPRQRVMLKATTRWSARVATHIVAPSEATAQDIRNHLKVPEDRITVIHHGVGSEFAPAPPSEVQRVRQQYGLSRRYVLAVGTRQPRKNYVRLAQGVRTLLDQGQDVDLVLAGKPGWLSDRLDKEVQTVGLDERLRLLDYVAAGDLPALYSGAAIAAMPSLYEGFGLPLLEAMACGTPTVASNRASLPEIAGGASLLFDAMDSEELSRALLAIMENPELHDKLRRAGVERAARFTWSNAAVQTASVFRRALAAAATSN